MAGLSEFSGVPLALICHCASVGIHLDDVEPILYALLTYGISFRCVPRYHDSLPEMPSLKERSGMASLQSCFELEWSIRPVDLEA